MTGHIWSTLVSTRFRFSLNFPLNRLSISTLYSTLEARGKVAVNSEKEVIWLSIQRKMQSCCQFEEEVNQRLVIFHPTPIGQKKKRTWDGVGC